MPMLADEVERETAEQVLTHTWESFDLDPSTVCVLPGSFEETTCVIHAKTQLRFVTMEANRADVRATGQFRPYGRFWRC